MYKNMNRYINRTNDDKKLQGSMGRIFARNENVNEFENFVNSDEYGRNRSDCEINNLHKCVKFKNEGQAIKIVFLVLGDINVPGCPPPPPPPPSPATSSSGSKKSNEDGIEILLDSEGNLSVNGNKLEAKVLEDGSSIFTINVNSDKKSHNEEEHADKKATNEENNTEKKNNNEEKHVDKEAHNKEKHTEKKTSIVENNTEKIATAEQSQPAVKQ